MVLAGVGAGFVFKFRTFDSSSKYDQVSRVELMDEEGLTMAVEVLPFRVPVYADGRI